jgi:hypothetical protein
VALSSWYSDTQQRAKPTADQADGILNSAVAARIRRSSSNAVLESLIYLGAGEAPR